MVHESTYSIVRRAYFAVIHVEALIANVSSSRNVPGVLYSILKEARQARKDLRALLERYEPKPREDK